ncbi:ABC transporter ATP-binding protein [Mycobacterium sp. KBS0706]|uniref:ABC transporter ATP-binding protein n=1 Tax=Mycobacterium sp. KBS0706 TaxID=2578109 RepID=UPI00110F9715|nr:ABC transporter ATP-binding protein [Mycobacterium sp. KBS0706]TSD84515.1 ABC transporter ATP-binding protein [Mycobacterium sp. KBS0706]
MHFEPRLWQFTQGVRARIAWAVAIGLISVALGVARLALLGWLIGQVFAGRPLAELVPSIVVIAGIMVLRGVAEYGRVMVAHETASRVQARLRRSIFDRIAALGPGTVARRRSGALTLSLIDGVEQLEVYFGQFLPQFLIALLTPILIFAAIAFVDLPVAAVMLGFALIALFGPALWHRRETGSSLQLRQVYADFAAEFLDSVQGLATLKAFGQSGARATTLKTKAQSVFRSTMRVLGSNVLARGITDSAIASGAAAALALGAWRVDSGAMALSALLVILMLGVEIFRPMRELRSVLHQGMVGLSAAQGIYQVLDDTPEVADAAPAALARPLAPTIAFDGVRFRYPGTRRTIHEALSFEAKAGERIGLVGPSGGGKSSIVRLLLRFYDPEAGTIRLGGHDLRGLSFAQIRSMISVVNQDTFLFHGTVEENIRMGRPGATEAEVEAAARAANIHGFVQSLPQGYRTVVGEKGVKLSGGQRQRVAIARALLRDTPILVLDEALSAVDAENEAVIQEALDRLMQGRTTLVLAHRLSSVIGCDRILVLDRGRVVESGPHAALMQQGGVYAGLMAEQARESAAGMIIDAPVAARTVESASTAPATAAKSETEGILKAEGLGWGRLVAELMKLAMPWKGKLALTFAFGVLRVVTFIGVGVLSALVLLALKNGEPYGALLWALAVVAPLSGVLHWLESWIAHDMAFRLLADMRSDVFRKLDALAPAYLVRRRTGDLMALVTHDIELVEYFFAHTVAPAFVAVLVPAAVLAVLVWASPWIALALLPFLLAVAVSPFLMRRRVDTLGSESREAAGELGAFAVDSVQGLGEIVAFQQEGARGDRLDALSQRFIRLRLPFFAELTRQQSLLEILTGLGGLAVVVTGAALSTHGAIDPGLLPLLTILAMAAFLPVSEIAQVGRQLADTLGATRRIYGLKAEPVPVVDGPGVPDHAGPAALALQGVGFTYPGQGRRALAGVTVEIPAGKTVALVGTSGAGKTTTAQLLMRFWDTDEGRITLNGADLRDYALDDLRRRIALVAQDTYLFNDTLRANILIARPEASEAELAAAIGHASLAELVETLPEGLGSPVGERGTALSGGQRQRVAIARAFLKNASVLILDEATSHLDTVNEQAVRRALDRLQADRTTIVIAHRLSTVRDADLIVVLDEGRVAETGTHAALLARGGLYAQLVSRQLASAQAAQ